MSKHRDDRYTPFKPMRMPINTAAPLKKADKSWRDEKVTRGEVYDALMDAAALVEKGLTPTSANTEFFSESEHRVIRLIAMSITTFADEAARQIKGGKR